MSLRTDEIFALLPAFLRLKDAEEGRRMRRERAPGDTVREIEDFGPLRTLASLVAREGQIVREGINAHYDNAFIETCSPWVIPYLGELLGVRGLADIPEGIDTRDKPALARIGMAFERDARNVEVRRIETAGGRWNLGNIGLHLWRLRPYAITLHRVDPVGTRRDFRFHPLGCDAQLFARTGIRGGVEEPARESDMPAPITRAIMAEDESRFYGPGRAIHIRVGTEDVPVKEIRAANLGSLPGGGPGEPDWTRTGGIPGLTLIDPELGRVVIDPDRSGPVRLSCHFARPLEIGGGEHSRVASIGSVEDGVTAAPSTNLVTSATNEGGAGVILLEQSTHYTNRRFD